MPAPAIPLLRFRPVYQSRVWGGRSLETRFGRELPDATTPYGESWEIAARPEADVAIAGNGPLAGRRLSQLWADPALRRAIFGPETPETERFPLLCKILDARETLSIQVHPPALVADELGGEPKSEVWYIAHAEPGAALYVGVLAGTTRESFAEALAESDGRGVESLVHRIPVSSGQHLYIPSGRLHAIGGGLLIHEIQESSDTTYRVYDWGRLGLDGKPRELHLEASLRCIDFGDVAPSMDRAEGGLLCDCPYFRLEKHRLEPGADLAGALRGRFAILTMLSGILEGELEVYREGDYFLAPAEAEGPLAAAGPEGAEWLLTTWS